jgi:hypothetical protein
MTKKSLNTNECRRSFRRQEAVLRQHEADEGDRAGRLDGTTQLQSFQPLQSHGNLYYLFVLRVSRNGYARTTWLY